jgi:hypothetical protein
MRKIPAAFGILIGTLFGILFGFLFTVHPAAQAASGHAILAVLRLDFIPEKEEFIPDAQSYTAIWEAEKARIIRVMERLSADKFREEEINVIVYEGPSESGEGPVPMRMRASYPPTTKRAALVHELAHRLMACVPTTPEVDEHRKLFLVLYDMWVDLYGKRFADHEVEAEKARSSGEMDYEAAWNWALAFTKPERRAKYLELKSKSGNVPRPPGCGPR